jgi:MFS transporter, SP family, general alpha glucoside:H+ symporter
MATEKRDAGNDIHVESAHPDINRLENVDLHDMTLNSGAQEATAQEHSLGFIQGFKTYKRAAFWSIGEFLLSIY